MFGRTVRASRIWTVDGGGGGADFKVIQYAIGNATDGDTIVVFPGTYSEHIFVDKSLTIVSQDNGNTVIDGNGAASVVTLAAGGISLSGFSVQHGDEGLRVVGNDNNVSDNIILRNNVGVILDSGCTGNILSNNTVVLSNMYGLYGDRCGSNIISGNEISFNSWDGVFLYASGQSVLENNAFSSNGWDGVRLRYSSNNTVVGNSFSANKNGLHIYSDEDPIRPSGLSRFNVVEQNDAMNNSCGIKIEHAAKNVSSAENLIRLNFFAYNDIALNISGSSGNSICNNNFINNSRQAFVIESFNNTWDAGYYVGGNYWSDHTANDLYWGVAQNETGSDGIIDEAYMVSENLSSVDLYPFARQYGWLENVEVTIVSPINGMYRTNPIPLALVMNKPVWASYALDGQANVSITGNVVFSNLSIGVHSIEIFASDSVGNEVSLDVPFTVTFLGDISLDGRVNIIDIAMVAYSFDQVAGGERWNPDADLNNDGVINIVDIAIVARDFDSEIAT